MKASVIVVDDDPGVRFTIRAVLEDEGFAVRAAEGGEAALRLLDEAPCDVLLTDLRMPGMDGMALLRAVGERPEPRPRVVMITAHGSERTAVEAMKAGAWDYFAKPFEVDELVAVVRRAAEAGRLRAENERLASELHLSRSLVFASEAMSRVARLVRRVGPRDVTVLITGESGTGKERVAEAIVEASRRSDRPFVRFNCASLNPELAEAELFGHGRGAFTGAHRARPGLFREADGGTILLDEVGELDLSVQARLLRVLQDGEVRPVGADRPVRVDVRVLAATHRDLLRMVAEGKFREDLYYRLAVVTLHVPPLRERPEDVAVLTRHFLRKHAERFGLDRLDVPPGLVERLQAMPWPGNVRELENAVEMLVALSEDGRIDAGHLVGGAGPAPVLGLKERVDAFERGLVAEALRAARGNRSQAARLLGISRVTLYEKLKKHGLG